MYLNRNFDIEVSLLLQVIFQICSKSKSSILPRPFLTHHVFNTDTALPLTRAGSQMDAALQ